MRSEIYLFLIGLLLLGFCLGSGVAVAEAVQRPKKVISVNPLALAQGWINFQDEKVFRPDASIASEWSFFLRGGVIGLGYTGGGRKYIKPIAPEGFWFGARFGYVFLFETYSYYSSMLVRLGGNLGYKFLLGGVFTIEPYLGAEYIIGTLTGYEVVSGYGVLYGLNIGFAF
ncbi:hypothetical protein ES702_07809 [subsurface metagenome]